MAALRWLTPRRQSATERSVLAGEAAAEAAESALAAGRAPQDADRDTHGDRADRGAGEPGADEPRFPVPGDPRAAAFFDLDNTVMQGAAIFHFGRGLYKRKFFAKRDLLRFAWQQAYFRLAGAEDPEHMQDARDSALSIVKGHRVEETHVTSARRSTTSTWRARSGPAPAPSPRPTSTPGSGSGWSPPRRWRPPPSSPAGSA